MKNFSNVSLTLFIIFLVSASQILITNSVSFSTSITSKSLLREKANNKNLIKSSNKNKQNIILNSDSYNFNNLVKPNFINMGFKCIRYVPKVMFNNRLCGYKGQKCLSKGIVFMGPLKDREYKAIITKPLEEIDCSFDYFGIKEKQDEQNEMSIKCFTHPLENSPDIVYNHAEIPTNYFNHRLCINGEPSKNNFGILIKQGVKSTCDSRFFGIAKGQDCKCYEVSYPEDYNDSIDDLFFPIRISSTGDFECISLPGGLMCNAITSYESCLLFTNKTTEIHSRNTIMKVDESLYNSIREYYFNRWICPSESGMNVAVMFNSNDKGKTYSISCLGRNGEDCFYNKNADSVCMKVVDCPKSIKDFGVLTCGTKEFKAIWSNDGFNVPSNTWCKNANAWLRFDGTFKITESENKDLKSKIQIGVVMLGDGMTACIPDSKKDFPQCLYENESSNLIKEVEYYNDYISSIEKYSPLLKCNDEALKEAINNENHWCFKPLILPNSQGIFSLNSGLNNLKINLGKHYSKDSTKREKFLFTESWLENIDFTEINFDETKHLFFVEDVNGDGYKDLVLFGDKGVYVSLNNFEKKSNEFKDAELWVNEFGVETGINWKIGKHPRFLIDLNFDKKADIVGFGDDGVYVSLSDGNRFLPPKKWISGFSFVDGGWRVDLHERWVIDIDNDGYPDIVGCGNDECFIALNKKSYFVIENSYTTNQNNQFFTYNKGWRKDKHLRFIIDINGDKLPDIVGIGNDGVYATLNLGGRFLNVSKWSDQFGFNTGWRIDEHDRIFSDVNNDGLMDIIGFGDKGVSILLNKGNLTFSNLGLKLNNLGKDVGGWYKNKHIRQVLDLNNDGFPDIVGFGDDYVFAWLNNKDNSWDTNYLTISNDFCINKKWKIGKQPRILTDINKDGILDLVAINNRGISFSFLKSISSNSDIKFEKIYFSVNSFITDFSKYVYNPLEHKTFIKDMNKDGLPDLVIFGNEGVYVSLNIKGKLSKMKKWSNNYSKVLDGWTDEKHLRFIEDVNKDGYPDIIGFGDKYVSVSLNLGGSSFSEPQNWISSFCNTWTVNQHPRYLIDVNFDGFPDIVGFADDGVYVSLNNQQNKFEEYKLWNKGYGFTQTAGNWRGEDHIRLIIDMNNDGYPDVVGFSSTSVIVSINSRKDFLQSLYSIANFGANNWNKVNHPRFVIDLNKDSYPDIIGFSDTGVLVSKNNGNSFTSPTKWSDNFGKVAGKWDGTKHERYVIDINKDGYPDIIGFNDEGLNVSLNNKGENFELPKIWTGEFVSSSWTKTNSFKQFIDMDGDGYPDILAIKNNTVYVSKNGQGL